MTDAARQARVKELGQAQRRDPVLVGAVIVVLVGIALSWATIDVEWEHAISGRSILDRKSVV